MKRITIDVKAESRDEGVEEIDEGKYLVRVKATRMKGRRMQPYSSYFGSILAVTCSS